MAEVTNRTTMQEPTRLEMLQRQLDYWWTAYKRTWKGSVITSFVQPWLYVGAMGVLLGDHVDDSGSGSSGKSAPSSPVRSTRSTVHRSGAPRRSTTARKPAGSCGRPPLRPWRALDSGA